MNFPPCISYIERKFITENNSGQYYDNYEKCHNRVPYDHNYVVVVS